MDKFVTAVIEKYRPHARLHKSLGVSLAKFAEMEWMDLYKQPLPAEVADRLKTAAQQHADLAAL